MRLGRPFVVLWLLQSLLALSVRSKDTWIEVQSPHFTVISNAGDKEARKVADQFEEFREVFHTTFPNWRLELGKPLIIFAVRNEDSLRALLPAYWEEKNRAHPAGIYIAGEDRHYVALRTNVETENPYQVVYHEYTHAILNLNFRELPVWLNEGLAEFYANSIIEDKDVEIGRVAPYHLRVLQTERLIPIDVLFSATQSSPYYNEANHASMFYAESWAITHYLMMDPDARKRELMKYFLTDLDATGDSVAAAEKTFGNLKTFASSMDAYARQRTFVAGKIPSNIHSEAKSYSSRELSAGELEAERALFYVHTRRPKEAGAAVNEALKDDPKLPLAYEAQGFLHYSQLQFQAAETDFRRAIELGSNSFFPYYLIGKAQLRDALPLPEDAAKAATTLEKAVHINPQFAPAYSALATVYSINAETYEKAYADGRKAITLEPGNLTYAVNYAYILMNTGKIADAKVLAQRIRQAAKSPFDQDNAQRLLEVIADRERAQRYAAQGEQRSAVVVTPKAVTPPKSPKDSGSSSPADVGGSTPAPAANPHAGESEYAVEGTIVSADCGAGPGKVVLSVGKSSMNFRFGDFAGLQVISTAKQDSGNAPGCGDWKGRRARVYFYKVKDARFMGDLNTIQFL
jgi:Tfp pilus assembly protein PilF